MLLLSPFTGAARELTDALVVNPYDTEALADAILAALEMDPAERTARMRRMREVVRQNNVYRWAANLIGELCDVRLDTPVAPRARVISPSSPPVAEAAASEVVVEKLPDELGNPGAVAGGSEQIGVALDLR